MENIKTYDEFVNEGFFDLMTKRPNDNTQVFIFISTIVAVISWIVRYNADLETTKAVSMILASVSSSPLAILLSTKYLEDLYHAIRSTILLKKTGKHYSKAMEYIEKYPDVKPELLAIKKRMAEAIKNNEKKGISYCIHDIYEISKYIARKESLGEMSIYTEEEKQKMKEEQTEHKKVDPFEEEKWYK